LSLCVVTADARDGTRAFDLAAPATIDRSRAVREGTGWVSVGKDVPMNTIEVNGLRIAYERAGGGPPLVLLHRYVGDGPRCMATRMYGPR